MNEDERAEVTRTFAEMAEAIESARESCDRLIELFIEYVIEKLKTDDSA